MEKSKKSQDKQQRNKLQKILQETKKVNHLYKMLGLGKMINPIREVSLSSGNYYRNKDMTPIACGERSKI